MFLSVFEMFKVGIGPSSSHTMGPMVAAARFLDQLRAGPFTPASVGAVLHGSLAFTGKGHATDRAVILGLAGFTPEDFDAEAAEAALSDIAARRSVAPEGLPRMGFDPEKDLRFDYETALPGHANGMVLLARDAQGDTLVQQVFYSVGGGFVLTDRELAEGADTDTGPPVPYPFKTAAQMVEMAESSGLSIAAMKRKNELSRRSGGDLDRGLDRIWQVMAECIDRGLTTNGTLPGGLNVRRRAAGIFDALKAEHGRNQAAPHVMLDWMSAYAMAAAGLCAVLGGTPRQIENAAEIALEHHLGMTCDPIRGLVQVPCIERNGLGTIKAVSAASLALRGDGVHLVPLDAAIETMRQTGNDMSEKYKETSLGGLAVNVPNC